MILFRSLISLVLMANFFKNAGVLKQVLVSTPLQVAHLASKTLLQIQRHNTFSHLRKDDPNAPHVTLLNDTPLAAQSFGDPVNTVNTVTQLTIRPFLCP